MNGIMAMRKTDLTGGGLENVARAMRRALLTVAVVGIGLATLASTVRAADDDDDETFEEKVIRNIMTGLGGTNMENTGIEYRERSPLVVPPKIELRSPNDAAEINVPNWPKDPDVQRRKAAKAASQQRKNTPEESRRVLMPSELAQRSNGPNTVAGSESNLPGNPGANAILSPSQLGFNGFGNVFGGNKSETAPFKGEPTRESLTQPPVGYQTPSPAYAYGTGPKESLNKEYNPAAGKY